MGLNTKIEYLLIEVNQPKISVLSSMNVVINSDYELNTEYAGFIIIDKINKTQSWSPHFFKALGFLPNEILPSFESLEKIMHPCDFLIIKKIALELNQSMRLGSIIKARYKTKYNTYKILNTRVKLISKETVKY